MSYQLVSCLGDNTYPLCALIAEQVSTETGLNLTFNHHIDWQDAKTGLAGGQMALGWICGLLYTYQQDQQPSAHYRILGAPVFSGQTDPVYFSYLVVHKDSPFQTLADLHGRRLVINEPGSYSGNHALWAHLRTLDQPPVFARVLQSGGHSASMRRVAEGEAELAAIDHTVFDYWQGSGSVERRALTQQLRVIGQTDPAPAPPWVVSPQVSAADFAAIQDVLFRLHTSPLAAQLAAAGLLRIVPAVDADYDVLRETCK